MRVGTRETAEITAGPRVLTGDEEAGVIGLRECEPGGQRGADSQPE